MDIHKLENEKDQGMGDIKADERRTFLQLGLVISGVFLGGGVLSLGAASRARGQQNLPSVLPPRPPLYPKQYGMLIRQNRCIDCEKCLDACRETNHVPNEHDAWRTKIQERLTTTDGTQRREFRPILCNHCDRPPCVRVCPTKATYKDPATGIVAMNYQKCIGCKTCMAACPYNARYFNHHRYAIDKCNFCLDTRLAKGEKDTACVAACPAHVRIFGDLRDKQSEIYQLLHAGDKKIWVLRPECGALPNVFYMNA